MPTTIATRGPGEPVAKRQKVAESAIRKGTATESKIFAPFRTIGLVSSTAVPFTSIPLGKTSFQITTSVGRCLQTYDLKRGLNLVFLTRPQTPEDITATLAWKEKVFAAWGGANSNDAQGLWVFQRGKKVAELDVPKDLHEPVKQILIFGTWIVGCCTTRIEVWRSATYEHYTTLFPTAGLKGGNELTGGISNLPTYLNKIFAGRKDGSVEIWNVSSGKLIYTILPTSSNCGAVTVLQPTPALSLLAIAYSEGPLVIHDVRIDKTIIRLNAGSVSSISFRTDDQGAGDDGKKAGVMATATPEHGDVTFWDLNGGGKVMGVLRGAHNPPSSKSATVGGGVSKVEFLTGQPVIITSGLDNALKSWIFDETPVSPIPRILHSRSGHSAPVTRLQFLPTDADGADAGGKWLLSAGQDRSLWGWSLRRDGQSTELSQGNIRKKAKKFGILASSLSSAESSETLEDLKAPEITCIAMSLNRDGGMGSYAGSGAIWQKDNQRNKKPTDATKSGVTGWESVVTGHRDDRFARTWFWGRKKAGRWALATGDGGNVSSVAVSPCGTFAVVGSETGGIDMFNLQSGIHRQRYPAKLTPSQARNLKLQQLQAAEGVVPSTTTKYPIGLGKHRRAVTGLVVDSLNKNLITCSIDGKVKFWDFYTGALVDELDWSQTTTLTSIRYHAPNDLIAVTCSDNSIRIIDIETKRTIRELWGCQGGINDLCFSNDGRWIIAASKDCILRVWDLPTGHLIDAIRTETQCTALTFSATGEFLATTCEGQLGVNIWNNKTLFTHVPTRHISEDEIASINNPTVSGEGGQGLIEGAFEKDAPETETSAPALSIDQLSEDMLTLSMVPKSRWQTLLHLDLIKARNKPTEAPKVPEKAPFFLPSLEKPNPVVNVEGEKKELGSLADRSRIMKMSNSAAESPFTVSLRAGSDTENYTAFTTHLKSLNPSSADLEIRSLNPQEEFVPFIHALTSLLRQKRDFELVQAWMAVFLRLHVDSLSVCDAEVVEALKEWREEMEKEGKRLSDLVGFCSGVVGFLRSPRT